MVEFRYIDWNEYGDLCEALAKKVEAGRKRFDLIVGIARGGIPVAMALSDHLDVKIDFINVKSYSDITERRPPLILSTLSEGIVGKDVLVVDDLVDQGDTMMSVLKFLAEGRPRSVTTAVLFKKPWSKFHPDFFLEEVKEWIVFPLERAEVARQVGSSKPAQKRVKET